MSTNKRQKIAIIGTGISGLGIASLLHPHHDIVVYEKNATLGGHSRTIDVSVDHKTIPVDTGFIVFNQRNYPLLTRLFKYLDVPITKSDMSFGVSINDAWLEYGTRKLAHIFAQRKNVFRPEFWRMLSDILRFNKNALNYIQKNPSYTLGQCLDDLAMGEWFREYFLLAMGGAIWSSPLQEILNFPAATFIRFFDNHGLLTVKDHPQWYTVTGGSRVYVEKLSAPFKNSIRVGCGVENVVRTAQGVEVQDSLGERIAYDRVVFACHADQALALLDSPSTQETEVLSAFQFQPNETVTHTDVSLMPKRKAAWASWVYLSSQKKDMSSCVSLSYWMNNLQPLATQTPILVTLNPGQPIAQNQCLDRHTFEHPLFNSAAITMQARLAEIQGVNNIWFCGAWQKYGFHEDGLASAVAVAEMLGVNPPW